jgi:hypothetical protein
MASVLASMQGNGNEAGLRRHEARALGHEIEHLILLVGHQFHGRDLSDDATAFREIRNERRRVGDHYSSKSLRLVMFGIRRIGTNPHRRAFKIATGVPPSPKRAGTRDVDLGCHSVPVMAALLLCPISAACYRVLLHGGTRRGVQGKNQPRRKTLQRCSSHCRDRIRPIGSRRLAAPPESRLAERAHHRLFRGHIYCLPGLAQAVRNCKL